MRLYEIKGNIIDLDTIGRIDIKELEQGSFKIIFKHNIKSLKIGQPVKEYSYNTIVTNRNNRYKQEYKKLMNAWLSGGNNVLVNIDPEIIGR